MKKLVLRICLFLFSLLVLGALAGIIGFNLINTYNGEIESSGEKRRYLLYVPESYNPAAPVPLVINIHGFAQWPAHQMTISHWNDLADEYGFIVVYPMGTRFPLRWRTYAQEGMEDGPEREVQFFSDLIDRLESQYNIDPARIYANGLSNGGGMSFLLACKLSERIAAIGTVAGAYTTPWSECNPGRPVPLMAFHGTDDPIVPYQGGEQSRMGTTFPSIPDWVHTYARLNGCAETPVELPASGEVSGIRYTACSQGAEVMFYTIQGGGHSWPGGEPIPAWIVGYTSPEIDASRVMWEFFRQHPLESKQY